MGRAAAASTIESTSERMVCCLFGCGYVPVVHVVVFGVPWRKQTNLYIRICSYIAPATCWHSYIISYLSLVYFQYPSLVYFYFGQGRLKFGLQ